jgi:magnesium chelatase family protein
MRVMTLATILSRTQQGLDAPLVRVEVDSSGGLPQFSIVGLPEAVVKESKDRVRAAIANCGFEFPVGASPSTLRRRTCPRRAAGSTCRLPPASSSPVRSCRRQASTARSCTVSSRSAE